MILKLSPRKRTIAIAIVVMVVLLAGIVVAVLIRNRGILKAAQLAQSTQTGLRVPRRLGADAVGRIRALLQSVPVLDVEVGGLAQDHESLLLAGDIRGVFDGPGFKLRKLAEHVPSGDIPSGVAVYSKHELDQVVSDAIAQLFTELEQPIQWLEEPTSTDSTLSPDIRIVVGTRPP